MYIYICIYIYMHIYICIYICIYIFEGVLGTGATRIDYCSLLDNLSSMRYVMYLYQSTSLLQHNV